MTLLLLRIGLRRSLRWGGAPFGDVRRDHRIHVSGYLNAVGRMADTPLDDLANLHACVLPASAAMTNACRYRGDAGGYR